MYTMAHRHCSLISYFASENLYKKWHNCFRWHGLKNGRVFYMKNVSKNIEFVIHGVFSRGKQETSRGTNYLTLCY